MNYHLFKNVPLVLVVTLLTSPGFASGLRPGNRVIPYCLPVISVADTTPQPGDKILIDGEEFLKPSKEAIFRGNNKKWERYFQGKMKTRLATMAGTCEISFVVDENGDVKEVRAIRMSNPAVAKAAIDIIKDSPKWAPAEFNGEKIKSYRVQDFSLSTNEVKEMKTEMKQEPRISPTRKGTHF